MKLFQSTRGLLTTLLLVALVAGLAACGGTGGESDTDAPILTLEKVPVSTIVRTRVLSGTVEPGAQMEISRNSAVVSNPLPDANGTWTSTIDLVSGVNTIAVKATDATGNNKTLVFPLTYDVFTLDQVLLTTSVQGQTLSGTLANGGSLSGNLKDAQGSEVQTISGISSSNWTQVLDVLPDGTYTLSLTGTDDIGNTTPLTQTLVIGSALPLLTVNPATPVGNTVSLSGTATDTATVSIVAPTGVTGAENITRPTSDTWSCDLSELQPGRNLITITATTTAADGATATATAQLAVLYQPPPETNP